MYFEKGKPTFVTHKFRNTKKHHFRNKKKMLQKCSFFRNIFLYTTFVTKNNYKKKINEGKFSFTLGKLFRRFH
jgi:hypothetical protein